MSLSDAVPGSVLLAVLLATTSPAVADEAARARQDYMLNCQGCHLADGRGSEGRVPRLAGFVGRFLDVPGGREYLVQVPGVASASLDDASLARLMNWLLVEFGPASTPVDHPAYTADEVRDLRRAPLRDPAAARAELIEKMPP